jgi:hypothetical protein
MASLCIFSGQAVVKGREEGGKGEEKGGGGMKRNCASGSCGKCSGKR